jgi:hypothetical protein
MAGPGFRTISFRFDLAARPCGSGGVDKGKHLYRILPELG